MRINYYKLLEFNREALTPNGEDQLACYFLIQRGVEEYLMSGNINEQIGRAHV